MTSAGPTGSPWIKSSPQDAFISFTSFSLGSRSNCLSS